MSSPFGPGRELGLAGMLAIGLTPVEARARIRADLLKEPGALALLRDLPAEVLAASAADWKRYGLRPPWEDDPEVK